MWNIPVFSDGNAFARREFGERRGARKRPVLWQAFTLINLSAYDGVQSTYQLFPTGNPTSYHLSTKEQMKRVGDAFVPSGGTARDKKFHILAADFVFMNGWGEVAPGALYSTQRPRDFIVDEAGNYVNFNVAWRLPPGVFSTANFLRDDGSVTKFQKVHFYSINEGSWLTVRGDGVGYYLPAEMAQ